MRIEDGIYVEDGKPNAELQPLISEYSRTHAHGNLNVRLEYAKKERVETKTAPHEHGERFAEMNVQKLLKNSRTI